MGAFQSKQIQQKPQNEERSRTFSISPSDWSTRDYREVVAFLRDKYPTAHVTLHAEKNDGHLTFERPLSFEEGDIHIVIVYDAVTERIMGFYNGADPVG
jgi:hypothetical protein